MLADRRAENLATNFAGQWLYLRNLATVTPDMRLFPDFDDNLRQAFRQETELFFDSIVQEDRSVLDLLKANYTYLNERLAKHYGIPNIYGNRFRRVELADNSQRGGLLRQGSILTVTSYATRTSPVIRGKWVLENLLGSPPPKPPANVPSLKDNTIAANLSVRERLAEHRANAACMTLPQIDRSGRFFAGRIRRHRPLARCRRRRSRSTPPAGCPTVANSPASPDWSRPCWLGRNCSSARWPKN